MSKFGWILVLVLLGNTALASWFAWRRYSLAAALDSTVDGTIVKAEVVASGKNQRHKFVAEYWAGGAKHIVESGPDNDSAMHVDRFPVGTTVPIYVSSADPRRAAFTRSAGYGSAVALAVMLALATGAVIYFTRRP
jgi:hypothetical protein